MLQPREHLYLLSRTAISELFARQGAGDVAFEPALFAEYDMFVVVGRDRLTPLRVAEVDWFVGALPTARMVRACWIWRTGWTTSES